MNVGKDDPSTIIVSSAVSCGIHTRAYSVLDCTVTYHIMGCERRYYNNRRDEMHEDLKLKKGLIGATSRRPLLVFIRFFPENGSHTDVTRRPNSPPPRIVPLTRVEVVQVELV